MKARTSLREIEQITKMGVQFEFEKELGRNLDLGDLIAQYDALFLGIGLGPDSVMDIPGAQHPRVRGAVEMISKIKISPLHELSWIASLATALVVGGGNTALDAARELKGLGVPRVVVSYRRGESEMSGYMHELKTARQEGVEFWFHTLPVEFQSIASNRIQAQFKKTQIASDGKITLTADNLELETGLVLAATGQSKLEKLISHAPNLSFEKGRLLVDPKTGRTGNPKIFAGGDLTNGGMEVVNAVAEGKRAALAIHEGFTHG